MTDEEIRVAKRVRKIATLMRQTFAELLNDKMPGLINPEDPQLVTMFNVIAVGIVETVEGRC